VNALPIASRRDVRRYARQLVRRHPRELAVVILLQSLGTAAGLVTPWMLGGLVQNARQGGEPLTTSILVIGASVAAQAVLVRFGALASARLGEKILARLREEFVENVLALPLTTVERAGAGELVTRTTRDVGALAASVQMAIPDTAISFISIAFTLGAIALLDPVLLLPFLAAVPFLWLSTRWYLKRARPAYLQANASYGQLTEGLIETVDGARTVEALRIAHRRTARVERDIRRSYAAERRTLRLRSVYVPIADTSFILPVATTLLTGGLLHLHGHLTVAAVTSAALYMQQIIAPLDRFLFWMDELQSGSAAFARLLGVRRDGPAADGEKHAESWSGAEQPEDRRIALSGVNYAYREGRDVLHDIDLSVEPGERLAVVGPSGAGKSTLGRLIAGIHRPRSGTVTIGGATVDRLPPAELRRQVILVTQEHHVFQGTLRDNLLIGKPHATDAELEAALRAVHAWEWARAAGLDSVVGASGVRLSPPQAQQLALARLVLADPHTLVLDEATSLLDPHAARQLERSLAAVLAGRTVIAIAHRLHTAHDADRVVVLEDGRIAETGGHAELIQRGRSYASLWASWHGSAEEDRDPVM
jgi:ABC-type multidrug transport system fused ATPase/permease subunit